MHYPQGSTMMSSPSSCVLEVGTKFCEKLPPTSQYGDAVEFYAEVSFLSLLGIPTTFKSRTCWLLLIRSESVFAL